jgi:hypothetical protein
MPVTKPIAFELPAPSFRLWFEGMLSVQSAISTGRRDMKVQTNFPAYCNTFFPTSDRTLIHYIMGFVFIINSFLNSSLDKRQ